MFPDHVPEGLHAAAWPSLNEILKDYPEFLAGCVGPLEVSEYNDRGMAVCFGMYELADKYDIPELGKYLILTWGGELADDIERKMTELFWRIKDYVSTSSIDCEPLQKMLNKHAMDNLNVLRQEGRFQNLLKNESALTITLFNELAENHEKEGEKLKKGSKRRRRQ